MNEEPGNYDSGLVIRNYLVNISFIKNFVFLSSLAFGASAAFAQEFPHDLRVTVTVIADGDTLSVEDANKKRFTIRFSDMDTPEIEHTDRHDEPGCKTTPCQPGQPGGKAAKKALQRLVRVGDRVTAKCYEKDLYERVICHIYKGGTNINLEMIKNGWGWLPRDGQGGYRRAWIRDPASYEAEKSAKKQKLGAWGLPDQVSPQQWRRNCWNHGRCRGAEK